MIQESNKQSAALQTFPPKQDVLIMFPWSQTKSFNSAGWYRVTHSHSQEGNVIACRQYNPTWAAAALPKLPPESLDRLQRCVLLSCVFLCVCAWAHCFVCVAGRESTLHQFLTDLPEQQHSHQVWNRVPVIALLLSDPRNKNELDKSWIDSSYWVS